MREKQNSESIPEVAFVILLLSQSLRTCQKQIIISKKLIKDKATECIAKARVFIGIQGDNFHWYVKSLTSPRRKTQEPVLQWVLHYVFFLWPNYKYSQLWNILSRCDSDYIAYVQVLFVPLLHHEESTGGRASCMINLGTIQRWEVTFTHWSQLTGHWVSLDMVTQSKILCIHQESDTALQSALHLLRNKV